MISHVLTANSARLWPGMKVTLVQRMGALVFGRVLRLGRITNDYSIITLTPTADGATSVPLCWCCVCVCVCWGGGGGVGQSDWLSSES